MYTIAHDGQKVTNIYHNIHKIQILSNITNYRSFYLSFELMITQKQFTF